MTAAVPLGDSIVSALPDWSGRIWFVSAAGVVGTVDPASGAVRSLALGEKIGNSFAVDETGGVFIVSDGALYRFDATPAGAPSITWRAPYANTGTKKPGQTQAGSGTTPTLMGSQYVAITDNADPMNIVVLRRAKTVTGTRQVCTHPVFGQGAGSTDQSLIGTGRSMVVENNYGYSGPTATEQGAHYDPRPRARRHQRHRHRLPQGLAQRRARALGRPEAVALERPASTHIRSHRTRDGTDAWYFTAIDFRTGKHRLQAARPAPGSASTTTTRRSAIGPDGVGATSARSAASSASGTADAGSPLKLDLYFRVRPGPAPGPRGACVLLMRCPHETTTCASSAARCPIRPASTSSRTPPAARSTWARRSRSASASPPTSASATRMARGVPRARRVDRLRRDRERGRGAAGRAELHQALPAAVQHPAARRQVVPYIGISLEEPYPRVYFTRERHRPERVYFGPFSSAKRVRETLDLLGRLFPYRTCEGPEPGRASGSPCLDYFIKRCQAPCVGYISPGGLPREHRRDRRASSRAATARSSASSRSACRRRRRRRSSSRRPCSATGCAPCARCSSASGWRTRRSARST